VGAVKPTRVAAQAAPARSVGGTPGRYGVERHVHGGEVVGSQVSQISEMRLAFLIVSSGPSLLIRRSRPVRIAIGRRMASVAAGISWA
jgi:hypothetical protein